MIRFSVHVHPGSKSPGVGGEYGGALIVRTRARAVDGRATEEVIERLATGFALRRADVTLVRGATSRTKLFEVRGDDERLATRLGELLATTSSRPGA